MTRSVRGQPSPDGSESEICVPKTMLLAGQLPEKSPLSELFPEPSPGFSALAACQNPLWRLEKGPDPCSTTHTPSPLARGEHRSVLTQSLDPASEPPAVSMSTGTAGREGAGRQRRGGAGRARVCSGRQAALQGRCSQRPENGDGL